ncbi:MAG: hypothetical protein Q4C91_19325 [Eubacteriales bacterium]|nr:hypothetical protein [Eubacteriales bacterium]
MQKKTQESKNAGSGESAVSAAKSMEGSVQEEMNMESFEAKQEAAAKDTTKKM